MHDQQARLGHLDKVTSIECAKNKGYKICVAFEAPRTQIYVLDQHQAKPIDANSVVEDWIKRIQTQGNRRNPLAKALGVKPEKKLSIIDLTAGFGRDAIIMAHLGGQVTMIEQSIPLCLLLEEAIALLRNTQDPALNLIGQRVKLIEGDFVDHLNQGLTEHIKPNVLYFDPMYAPTTKTALPKADIQCLKHLVGYAPPPLDWVKQIDLFPLRLVVKRNPRAPKLFEESNFLKLPTFQVKTKQLRFDVYELGQRTKPYSDQNHRLGEGID